MQMKRDVLLQRAPLPVSHFGLKISGNRVALTSAPPPSSPGDHPTGLGSSGVIGFRVFLSALAR